MKRSITIKIAAHGNNDGGQICAFIVKHLARHVNNMATLMPDNFSLRDEKIIPPISIGDPYIAEINMVTELPTDIRWMR